MKINVLFFGVLKDVLARSEEAIDLPPGSSVRDLLLYYAHSAPQVATMRSSLAISVNQNYAADDHLLREGDEVGLLPPVSGGLTESGEAPHQEQGEVRLVCERIDTQAVVEGVKQPAYGAIVTFAGTVRDNTRGRRTRYLDYEAYEAMALTQMESLAAESRTLFGVQGVSIFHRLGRLEIGETSVFIAVAAAHRGPAFEACRWIIDTLKRTVPIWKKEYFEDGAVWADGEPFPAEIRWPGGKVGGQSAS